MIDRLRHLSLHRRISLSIWVVSVIICLILLAFVLR